MFHRILHILVYPFMKILYRVKVVGKENMPKKGPLILACNHTSYLDSVMAGFSIFPRSAHYMGKKELFKIPIFKWLIIALGAFPVERGKADRSAIKKAIEILNNDGTLIMFPQGTRKKDINDSVFDGTSYFAYKTGAPVLPVAIMGTDKIMPEGKKIPRFKKITIKIGKPFSIDKGDKEAMEDLTKKIMQKIMEML